MSTKPFPCPSCSSYICSFKIFALFQSPTSGGAAPWAATGAWMCVRRVRGATSFHMDWGTEERWTFLCGSQGSQTRLPPRELGTDLEWWRDDVFRFIFSPWELQCKLSKSCLDVNDEFWWVLTGLLQVPTLRIMRQSSQKGAVALMAKAAFDLTPQRLPFTLCPTLCMRTKKYVAIKCVDDSVLMTYRMELE